MNRKYYVKATWDHEASVWISESDIPGLVIEAETLEEFEKHMAELVPEMLATNANVHNARVDVAFLTADHREFAVA